MKVSDWATRAGIDYICQGEYSFGMESAEHIFRALSDGTRLRILHFLRGGELCVGDLVELLEVPQPTASRHLNYLRKTGLVSARRVGLWGFYSLCEIRTEFHRLLLNCLDHCGDLEPQFKVDSRRVAALRKSGGCCPDLAPGPGADAGADNACSKPRRKRQATGAAR